MHKHLHALARACTYTHTHTHAHARFALARTRTHACTPASTQHARTCIWSMHRSAHMHTYVHVNPFVFMNPVFATLCCSPMEQKNNGARMHPCTRACTAHILTSAHACTQSLARPCTHLHIHTHTHTHMHDLHLRACTHAHSHSCMHTSKHTACTYMHLVHAQKRTHAHECTRKSICFHESHICDSEDSAGDSGKKNNGRQNRQTDR